MRFANYHGKNWGLRLTGARPEALVAASGSPLGLLGFMLTSPSPLVQTSGSIVLLVSAVLFTAVLSSATLLSEHLSRFVLFALLVGLYCGTWVHRRRCMVGAVIAHGLMAAGIYSPCGPASYDLSGASRFSSLNHPGAEKPVRNDKAHLRDYYNRERLATEVR